MFRRFTMAAAAAALALGLAGCADGGSSNSGSTSATTTTGSAGGGDAVAWAEQVCKSVEADISKLSSFPEVDTSNAEAAKSGLISYLQTVTSALDNIVKSIKDAGPPPVADGQQAVDRATQALQSAKSSIDQAKSDLEKAPAGDQAALERAVTKFAEDMSKLGDPFADLDANQALKEASEKAPSCQKLEGGGTTSSAPTS